jgi:hypothetical protein
MPSEWIPRTIDFLFVHICQNKIKKSHLALIAGHIWRILVRIKDKRKNKVHHKTKLIGVRSQSWQQLDGSFFSLCIGENLIHVFIHFSVFFFFQASFLLLYPRNF